MSKTLKIGMIFKTPLISPTPFSGNRVIQITGLIEHYAHYIYLDTGVYSAQFQDQFKYCIQLETHPAANLVCLDCQKFCQQFQELCLK